MSRHRAHTTRRPPRERTVLLANAVLALAVMAIYVAMALWWF